MAAQRIPHHIQRMFLPLKAVLVRCLNEDGQVVAAASGFVRRDGSNLWLYTCWHVVTGYDPHDVRIGNQLPNRTALEVHLQDAQIRKPGVESIGGLQTVTIQLYDDTTQPRTPLWQQDRRHVPHDDLNGQRIFVPFWHDAVRIALPRDMPITDLQVADEDGWLTENPLLAVGERVFVVGFPYGYSALGGSQPTPVVLTRFIAAERVGVGGRRFLLDGAGAPCMSGGPVFVERESEIFQVGLYTGVVYPDYEIETNNPATALGAGSNMSLHFMEHLPFVHTPDEYDD